MRAGLILTLPNASIRSVPTSHSCVAIHAVWVCRLMRDMQSRTQQEHSEKLAASNAAIVRHAARALIRDCDTLQLIGIGPASSSSSADGAADGSHGHSAAESGSHGHAAGGHRISGLICFDEMQVGQLGRHGGGHMPEQLGMKLMCWCSPLCSHSAAQRMKLPPSRAPGCTAGL